MSQKDTKSPKNLQKSRNPLMLAKPTNNKSQEQLHGMLKAKTDENSNASQVSKGNVNFTRMNTPDTPRIIKQRIQSTMDTPQNSNAVSISVNPMYDSKTFQGGGGGIIYNSNMRRMAASRPTTHRNSYVYISELGDSTMQVSNELRVSHEPEDLR